uniref:Predicted protein n=1 Tax=Hordeum vulgare subsp. vulgare TaxID=112509 RepID=F2DDW3_HORVV|nr:predicted protein [Hordeum vulgare subsp. vulgare]
MDQSKEWNIEGRCIQYISENLQEKSRVDDGELHGHPSHALAIQSVSSHSRQRHRNILHATD